MRSAGAARRHADAHRIARVIAQPLTGKPCRVQERVGPARVLGGAAAVSAQRDLRGGARGRGHGKNRRTFCPQRSYAFTPGKDKSRGCSIDRPRLGPDARRAGIREPGRIRPAWTRAGRGRLRRRFGGIRRWLAGFLPKVGREDLLIITADHGNDPAFRGTDHTREELPLLAHYDGLTGPLGTRETLADVAATLAEFFRLKEGWRTGSSFLNFKTLRVGKLGLRK